MAPPAFTVLFIFLTNKGFFSFSILNPFSQAKVVSMNRPIALLSSSALTTTCYESPKQENVSHAFEHLIQNLKAYNGVRI